MNAFLRLFVALALISACSAALAQTPAPVLGTEKDEDGKPLPFGRPVYKTPDTPLGSGPFKAIMATDDTLPAHVMYYPKEIDKAGKLPVIVWGNGACVNAGNRFRIFLTEIASHGFLAIASGVMAPVKMEVGPQENPAVRKPGDPPLPANAQPAGPPPTTPAQMVEAIDWAVKENSRQGSKFYAKLDITKIAAAGQSCGGGQALEIAGDPRLTTIAFFGSSSVMPKGDSDPRYQKVHTSILFLTGDAERDIGYPARDAVYALVKTHPIFTAWKDKLTHIGTYGMPDGGELGKIADNWFLWQLRGDKNAAKMFQGSKCTLCADSTWHVLKRNID